MVMVDWLAPSGAVFGDGKVGRLMGMRSGLTRALTLAALLVLSLVVASIGAWYSGGATEASSGMSMTATSTPDQAALAAEVAGLTRLPQPVVAPPVGNRPATTVKVSLE